MSQLVISVDDMIMTPKARDESILQSIPDDLAAKGKLVLLMPRMKLKELTDGVLDWSYSIILSA